MSTYDFLVASYETERLKTLSVWSQFGDEDMDFRPEVRARTPHEQMVHQCMSEDGWMRTMLGIDVGRATLPTSETRLEFLRHYADVSGLRLARLREQDDAWFAEPVRFFDAPRSRAWVLVRRLTHTAHHRGQLTVCLRLRGHALYSTFGPTADTGGLPQNRAPVIYRYADVDELLRAEATGGAGPPLPGPGAPSPTERPDRTSTGGDA